MSRRYCAAARTLARCHPDMGVVEEPTLIARRSPWENGRKAPKLPPQRTLSAVARQEVRLGLRQYRFARADRGQVGGNGQHVGVAEIGHDRAHQGGGGAVASALLKVVQLPGKVARR